MSLQEAYDHKPKRPLNTYMRFSVKRKAELKDSDVNIADTIKKEWE